MSTQFVPKITANLALATLIAVSEVLSFAGLQGIPDWTRMAHRKC